MMKRVKKQILSVGVGVLLSGAAGAETAEWTGGGTPGAWSDVEHWGTGALPAEGDLVVLEHGDHVIFDMPDSIQNVAHLFVGGRKGGALLEVKNGALMLGRSGGTSVVGDSSEGTIIQTGGRLDFGHILQVGIRENGTGKIMVSGGTFAIGRGGKSGLAGGRDGFSMILGDRAASSSGLFEISGGSMITRVGICVGPTGKFHVKGGAATGIDIGSHNNLGGQWYQMPGGVLKATIDGSKKGVTKIFIDKKDGEGAFPGDVVFEEGALLDLHFSGMPRQGSYVLMEWGGTVQDHGLKLAPGVDKRVWSFKIDKEKKQLIITSVSGHLELG